MPEPPSNLPDAKGRLLGLAALGLLLAVALGNALVYLSPFEDAFITFRYAEHLASGLGFAYNAGEQVEGFTSFSWTVLLAAVARLGLPVPGAACVLSLFCALAFLLVVWAVAGNGAEAPSTPLAQRLLPCALVAASGTYAYFAASGMETMLFACLLYGAALTFNGRQSNRRALVGAALLAFAAMTRPEGAGYALLLLSALAIGREDRRFALRVGAGFVLLFGPFYAWRWAHFGYPFPNTFYAKASPSLALFAAGACDVETLLTGQLFWLPVLAFAALVRWRCAERWFRLSSALFLGAVLQTVTSGGDTFAFYRFLLPAIPAAGRLLFGAYAEARRRNLLGTRRALHFAALAGLWLCLVGAAPFLPLRTFTTHRAASEYRLTSDVSRINTDYFEVGSWLKSHLPPNTLIATNAAGIVPYTSGLPTLDMLGLTDAHIAHVPISLGHGAIGHEKNDPAYVLSRKPDAILLGLPIPTPRHLRASEIATWYARWFPFLPGDRALFENPTFKADYRLVRAPITDNREVVLFLRKH